MITVTIQRASLVAAAVALVAITTLTAQTSEATPQLAQRIRQQIVRLPNYGVFDNIAFGIQGSKVYRRGQASRPTLKKSAERVIARIEGVGEVANETEVLPNSSFDEDVRAAVYVRIYGHTSLSRYNPNRGVPPFGDARRRLLQGISNDPPLGAHPIHVIVKRGNVTLEGVVDTEGDKTIAGVQANQVSGVFSVTNNLQFSQPVKRRKKKQ